MMNKSEPVFYLFACCIPVQGAKRAVMYDLNRGTWFHIPNDLAKILKHFQGKPKAGVYAQYDIENHKTLDSYFNFLEEHEFIFYTSQEQGAAFSPISMEWDYPAKISNAILDIGNNPDAYNIGSALAELESLGCGYLQLRQTDAQAVLEWDIILQIMATAAIFSIDLYIPYTPYSRETVERWATEHKRIQNVYIYGASKQSVEYFSRRVHGNLIYVTPNLVPEIFIQDPAYFTVTVPLFTESLRFNNYLNRKVYIDSLGGIRNAPKQEAVFGNVSKNRIVDIVDTYSFKSLWGVHKDMLLVCRDCEYRYMCVDNRIPVEDNDGTMWCFDTPCAYNPYIAKWRHEPEYVPAHPKFKKTKHCLS